MSTEANEADGAPIIENVNASIAALERCIEHLDEKIADGRGSDGALAFDRSNRRAFKRGILALRLHRAEVEGHDTAMLVLAELADTRAGMTLHTTRAVEAFERARAVLEEWGDDG